MATAQRKSKKTSMLLIGLTILFCSVAARGEVIRVAVASNFKAAAELIGKQYQQLSGHSVLISSGASGKFYAQISHGAPFDLFLSADQTRPAKLLANGIGVEDSIVTYARGRLVLWHPGYPQSIKSTSQLSQPWLMFLALANPDIAPYGMAAKQLIRQSGLESQLRGRVVIAENVSQAMHFAHTGHAQAAFVALSMVRTLNIAPSDYWLIDESLYPSIKQDMLLLRDTSKAREFWLYLQTSDVQQLIQQLGYAAP